MAREPRVSVVFATHDRAARLRELLESLERQELDSSEFEVVVVDDASSDDTPAALTEAERQGTLDLRVLRLDPGQGPAAARNAGWRAARAPLVVFTDDDCVASPEWLTAYLRAAAEVPGRVLQGPTQPRSDELHAEGPFSRTLRVDALGPYFQTCNVAYPRALLVRVGGFDSETFTVPGGEDADLAWRAMATGAGASFVPEAQVFHAVSRLGPLGRLRVAWRWSETVRIFARHRELRRRALTYNIFWKRTHYLLFRALLALLLPRRLRPIGWFLAYPYLAHFRTRGQVEGGGLALAPYYLLYDLVELVAMVRGSVRYRTLVL